MDFLVIPMENGVGETPTLSAQAEDQLQATECLMDVSTQLSGAILASP
jgi:hypothetical protein